MFNIGVILKSMGFDPDATMAKFDEALAMMKAFNAHQASIDIRLKDIETALLAFQPVNISNETMKGITNE